MSSRAFDPTAIAQVRGEARQALVERALGTGGGAEDLASLFDEFGEDASNTLYAALMSGLAQGINPVELAADYGPIWAAIDASQSRACTIARTEMLSSYRAAALNNYRANSDVVNGWVWIADQGPFTCGFCLGMDGSVHSLDEEMDTHPNCRCSQSPVTRSYDDLLGQLGLDASGIPETSFTRETGAEWLARQSSAVQDAVLGKAAGKLYRSGEISLADFVGYDRETLRPVQRSLKDMGYNWRDVLAGTGPSLEPTLPAFEPPLEPLEASAPKVQTATSGGWGDQPPAKLTKEQKAVAAAEAKRAKAEKAQAIAEAKAEKASVAADKATIAREKAQAAAAQATAAREAAEAKVAALEGKETRTPAQEQKLAAARTRVETAQVKEQLAQAKVLSAQEKVAVAEKTAASAQANATEARQAVDTLRAQQQNASAAADAGQAVAELRATLDDSLAQRELLYAQQSDLVKQRDQLVNAQNEAKRAEQQANRLDRAEYRAKIDLYHQTLDRSDPEVQAYFKARDAYHNNQDAIQAAKDEQVRLERLMDALSLQGKGKSAEFEQAMADYQKAAKAQEKAQKATQKLYHKFWDAGKGVYHPELDSIGRFEERINPVTRHEWKNGVLTEIRDKPLFTKEQIATHPEVVAAKDYVASLNAQIKDIDQQLKTLDPSLKSINTQIDSQMAQLREMHATLSSGAEALDSMRPFSDVIALPEGHQPPNALMNKLDYRMHEPREVTKRRIINDIADRLKDNPAWKDYVARTPMPDRLGVYHGYVDWHADPNDSKSAALVADWVKRWGVGYRPGSPEWVAMQMAAREEFGLDAVIHTTGSNIPAGETYYAKNGDAVRALLRAMYDNTQQWFAEQGITEIEVFRGYGWQADAEHLPSGVTWGPTDAPNYGVGDMELNPFQSFSADINISQGTGNNNGFAGGGFGGGSDYSLLIGAKVPVARVLATAQTGFGAKLESEIVVMGRAADTVSYRASTSDEAALTRQAEEQAVSAREMVYTLADGGQVHIIANEDGTFTVSNDGVPQIKGRYVTRAIPGQSFTTSEWIPDSLKPGKSKTYKTVGGVNKALSSLRLSNTYTPPALEAEVAQPTLVEAQADSPPFGSTPAQVPDEQRLSPQFSTAADAAFAPLPNAELAPMNPGTSTVLDFAAKTPGATEHAPNGSVDHMATELLKERASTSDPTDWGTQPVQWTASDLPEMQEAWPGADVVRLALTPEQRAALLDGQVLSSKEGAGFLGAGGVDASAQARQFASGKGAEITTAILRDDARTIDRGALQQVQQQLLREVNGNLAEARDALAAGDPSEAERVQRLQMLRSLYSDQGKLALLKGYDVITDERGPGALTYQIVNPAALRVVPPTISPPPDLTLEQLPYQVALRSARRALATLTETLEDRFGWLSQPSTAEAARTLEARLAQLTATTRAGEQVSLASTVELNPDLPPEIANQIAGTYAALAEVFPGAANDVRWIGSQTTEGGQHPTRWQPRSEGTLAHVAGDRPHLPPILGGASGRYDLMFNDAPLLGTESLVEYTARITAASGNGWFVQGSENTTATVIHEFGHLVHFNLLYGSVDPTFRMAAQEWMRAYATPEQLATVTSLSGYAAKDAYEAFAEAFLALYNGNTTAQWDHPAVQLLRSILARTYGPSVLPDVNGHLPPP